MLNVEDKKFSTTKKKNNGAKRLDFLISLLANLAWVG